MYIEMGRVFDLTTNSDSNISRACSVLHTFNDSFFFFGSKWNGIFGDGMFKHLLALLLPSGELHRRFSVRVLDIKASSILKENLKTLDVASSRRKVK